MGVKSEDFLFPVTRTRNTIRDSAQQVNNPSERLRERALSGDREGEGLFFTIGSRRVTGHCRGSCYLYS